MGVEAASSDRIYYASPAENLPASARLFPTSRCCRKAIKLDEKIAYVEEMQQLDIDRAVHPQKQVSEKYGISKGLLSTYQRQLSTFYMEREDDIKKSKNNSDAAFAKRKRLRGGGRGEKIPELGNELVQLINNNRSKGLRVDSDYVKQRALGYVATHYPELFESFKRSSTLLTRLRNVFKFSIRKVTHTKVVAIHDKLPGVRQYLAELRARLKCRISINTPIHSPDGAILIMNRFNADQVY